MESNDPILANRSGSVSSGHDLGAGIDFTDPNSHMVRWYMRGSRVLTFATFAAIFVLLNFVPLWHTDLWAHLKYGEWIVTHGRIPAGDPFSSFGDQTSATAGYCWLGQATLFLVFYAGEMLAGGDAASQFAGGIDALRFLHACLVTIRLAILLAAFVRLSGSWPLALGGLLFLYLLNFGNYCINRPQVFAELFFSILLFSLSRPVLSRRTILVLPAVMVLWANVHGSYPIGLILLGGVLLGRAIDSSWRESNLSWRNAISDPQCRRVAAVIVLSVVAIAFLNPNGPRIFLNTVVMASHPVVKAMDEWQPLSFQAGQGGVLAYGATVLLVTVTQLLHRRWFAASTFVLIGLFGLQPFWHQRALVWWMTLTPWLVMSYWPEIIQNRCAGRFRWETVPSLRKTIFAAVFIGIAALWSIPAQRLMDNKPVDLDRVLSQATPWRLAEGLKGVAFADAVGLEKLARRLDTYPGRRFSGRIFASETLGDYFLWAVPAEWEVFVTTHVHLIPTEHWDSVVQVRSAAPGWRTTLERNRVNLIVVEAEHNTRLCETLRTDSAWTVILDEAGPAAKSDPRCRLFAAIRIKPV